MKIMKQTTSTVARTAVSTTVRSRLTVHCLYHSCIHVCRYYIYSLEFDGDDHHYLQYEPIKYPKVYHKDPPLRRRADKVDIAEVAAAAVIAFLRKEGFTEFCESRTGGRMDPSAAQTALNR
jgi:hypothetical protein